MTDPKDDGHDELRTGVESAKAVLRGDAPGYTVEEVEAELLKGIDAAETEALRAARAMLREDFRRAKAGEPGYTPEEIAAALDAVEATEATSAAETARSAHKQE